MAKQNTGFNGNILHCVGVRYRIVGSGTLHTSLNSLDDVNTDNLADLTLAAATNREPLQLANFRDQRIQVEFGVNGFEEWFSISRIIAYVKETATGYPQ